MIEEKARPKPHVGVGVIIFRNGLVLFGKRKNAHGNGSWAPPGGHLEFGESFEQCAKRELMEETGLKARNFRVASVTNDVFNTEKHYVTVFVECDFIEGEAELIEPEKCEEWKWVEWNNLPQPLFLTIQNLLKQGYTPGRNKTTEL